MIGYEMEINSGLIIQIERPFKNQQKFWKFREEHIKNGFIILPLQ